MKIIYLPIFSKASNLSSSVKCCNLLGKVSTWFHLNRFSPKHHSRPCRWRQWWSVVRLPAAVPIDESLVSTVDMVGTSKRDRQNVSESTSSSKKGTIVIQGKKFKRISRFGSQWWLHECCICLGLSPCTSWNILYFTRPLQFDFVSSLEIQSKSSACSKQNHSDKLKQSTAMEKLSKTYHIHSYHTETPHQTATVALVFFPSVTSFHTKATMVFCHNYDSAEAPQGTGHQEDVFLTVQDLTKHQSVVEILLMFSSGWWGLV